jgi:hypothetical protein
MSQTLNAAIAVVGIDIGKNSFHIVGHDQRGAIVLRQKTAPKRHFRSAPINGHRQTGPAGPVRANSGGHRRIRD